MLYSIHIFKFTFIQKEKVFTCRIFRHFRQTKVKYLVWRGENVDFFHSKINILPIFIENVVILDPSQVTTCLKTRLIEK